MLIGCFEHPIQLLNHSLITAPINFKKKPRGKLNQDEISWISMNSQVLYHDLYEVIGDNYAAHIFN